MPSPAQFAAKFTERERTAVLHAHLELGIAQRAIPRLAAAGDLPEPGHPGKTLPAFTISRSTLRLWLERDSEDHRANTLRDQDNALAMLSAQSGALLALAEKDTKAVLARAKAGEEISPEEITRRLKMLASARAMVKAENPRGGRAVKSRPGPSDPSPDAVGDDAVARMLGDA